MGVGSHSDPLPFDMKSALALLSLASLVAATPAASNEESTQLRMSVDKIIAETAENVFGDVFRGAEHLLDTVLHAGEKISNKVEDTVQEWSVGNTEFVKQNDIVYERFRHASFPGYQIRVKKPQLCDPNVKQYSGYLDIDDDKHLFFWFFESRANPAKAPLVLWLNGGPGCSSSTGLLFELGPCNIANNGQNTTYNKYSWNTHANMLFLDQPINVGYSYSKNGGVNTSPVAAEDVWSFLELFVNRFPEYSGSLHISGESYGGTYLPNIAHVIHTKNKEIKARATQGLLPDNKVKVLHLDSVLIGNGLTEPYTQFASVPEYACDGPYPVFDTNGPQCTSLRAKVPTCQRLIKSCYDYNNRLSCVPAALYCWSQMFGSFQQLGLNPYDVRRKCNKAEDGDLCYRQLEWIETFMNDDKVKSELGAVGDREFKSCNMKVNQAFMMQGDGMHNAAALLPELIEDGVRLLIYAGNADFMCNAIGNLQWLEGLETSFQADFQAAKQVPFIPLSSKTNKPAGFVKTAGGKGQFTAGNVTYVQIYDAGHMVPYDQPEAALDMFVRWIMDTPLTVNPGDA
ncbi:Serine carboxypeptidase [Rhizoctonia solani]|uniref:Carboxypeptidase n=1 Tax=Rhizoctonia solani TaxID=456999 RepID=A0A8H8P0M7_9AGAM|nr:Serine carboxypeptidase [Rhizoctonia solani]QRW22368.1 Serine carboxypeptidase [Rhizoctonia solani]